MKEVIIDAKDKSLGRLASQIAYVLQGKDSAAYEPRNIGDNKVLVKNLKSVKFTGKKMLGKTYYKHTGYMGHLKERSLEQAWKKSPEWVLKHAVKGMLPKNSLASKRIKLLTIEQ